MPTAVRGRRGRFEALATEGRGSLHGATFAARPGCCVRRWGCGEGRRWRISRMSRLPRRRWPGWRNRGWLRWRTGSTPSSGWGSTPRLVGELEKLVREHPLRERPAGQLMLALYRAGRQADALEVYRQTSELLRDELGLEPSRQLRELERSILKQDTTLEPPASRRTRAADQSPGAGHGVRRAHTRVGRTRRAITGRRHAAADLDRRGRQRQDPACAAGRGNVCRGVSRRDLVCGLCRYHRSGADHPDDQPDARAGRRGGARAGAAARAVAW